MTPTINVNLKPCDCDGHVVSGGDDVHSPDCASHPILIPCPIPRSVLVKVRTGLCTCHGLAFSSPDCHPSCPGHPIRVTCSISGETWEESDVTSCHPVLTDGDGAFAGGWTQRGHGDSALIACRERWALVRALVLGTSWAKCETMFGTMAMFVQRDAVFAAIVKVHKAEDTLIDACGDYEEAMRGEPVGIYGLKRESTGMLERYVGRVIAQVMAIGGV